MTLLESSMSNAVKRNTWPNGLAPWRDRHRDEILVAFSTTRPDNDGAIMARHLASVHWLFVLMMGLTASMSTKTVTADDRDSLSAARAFIEEHERTIRPLEFAAALAWWNANVSGRDQDFKAKEDAQNRLDAALADHARFDRLKAIKSAKLTEPTLAREIDVLYLLYLEKQVDPELLKQITAKANADRKGL